MKTCEENQHAADSETSVSSKAARQNRSSGVEDISPDGATVPTSVASLSIALHKGFSILRLVTALLGLAFLFSNIYWVPEGSIAVHSRFGTLVGEKSGKPVRTPGGPYFAFPFPIDKIVRYPTSMQQVDLTRAFWLQGDETGARGSAALRGESFRPGVHGSLITGDKNLVQGTWTVRYQIDYSSRSKSQSRNVIAFARNLGSLQRAEEIIQILAQEAILAEVARTTVADFVAGRVNHEAIRIALQDKMTFLESGVRITGVSASRYHPPDGLADDFQAVTQAESEKGLEIEKAVRYRISTLSEVAGDQWEYLLQLLNEHQLTSEQPESHAQDAAFARVESLMVSGVLGGEVAQLVDNARTDKTGTIQRARARASRFTQLLPSYRRDPRVLKEQLRQDVLTELYSDPTSRVLLSPSSARLLLNTQTNQNQ